MELMGGVRIPHSLDSFVVEHAVQFGEEEQLLS